MWSNAVGFTVPVGGGNTLVPALLNLVVGDTRTLQALNASGQTVTGLTWTSSNRTVVSLSTDDPPLLTALAVGNVTITAGTAAADVTVSAATLPLGTVIWSNPGDGSGAQSILPAVPSTTGVADVFAFQADGTVQAIAADGTTAWTADISQAQAFAGGTYDMSQGTLLPDFQGGLVVMNNDGSIYKLDGITGQAYPAYTLPGPGCSVYCELPTGGLAVHPDGTIFTTYTDENGYNVIGIDPTTGTQKFMVPATFNGVEPFQGGSTTIIVAGDGYAYYSYPYLDSVYEYPATCRLGVLRVSSSGDAQSIPVFSATCGGWAGGIGYTYLTGANMITNADQGILLTWQTPKPDGSGFTSQMATITGGAAATAMEPAVPSDAGSAVVPVLQAQDGSFVGTFADENVYQNDMVAFYATGNVRWIVPNETPQIATADGGVIGQSGITYDQYGNATGQVGPLPTYSWKGAYTDGPVDSILPPFDLALMATSFAGVPHGNLTGNGFSLMHHTFGIVFCGSNPPLYDHDGKCSNTPDMTFSYYPGISDSNYAQAIDFSGTHLDWADTIKNWALEAYKEAFSHFPAIMARKETAIKLNHDQNPDNLNSFEHTVYVYGQWVRPNEPPRSTNPIQGNRSPYPPNGWTVGDQAYPSTLARKSSWVYYLPIMGNAQNALGCAQPQLDQYGHWNWYCSAVSPNYDNASTPPDSTEFGQLMVAIGKGIGRTAAHETAHQFVPTGPNLMDCITSCGSPDVYESGVGDGGLVPWIFVDPAYYPSPGTPNNPSATPVKANLHWGAAVANLIQEYLLANKN